MTLACPSCAAQYNLDESRIPAAGMQLRCPKCGTTFPVVRAGAPGASGRAEAGGAAGRRASPHHLRRGCSSGRCRSAASSGGCTSGEDQQLARLGGAGRGWAGAASVGRGHAARASTHSARRSSTTTAAAEGRVPLPASGAAPQIPPPASELDIDELFGIEPVPTPRAKPVIEIQHPKTATAEMPIAESDLELPSASSAARTIDAPQSLDLGADLGVAVPVMSQSAPQRRISSPGVPSPPPRVAPAIPPPKAPPAGKRSDSMEVAAVSPPSSPPASPPASTGAPPARPAPTLGRGQTKKRYQIRRVSGKVFGPFDEERVTRMLVDGELAGTESVKAEDGDWEPIGDVAAFAAVVPKAAPAAQPTGGSRAFPSSPRCPSTRSSKRRSFSRSMASEWPP